MYSFLFGLLHGILPDEHTWPITFSYAIGGASGKEGMKAGLYFSAAFTLQRMLISELAYLALAPFLLSSMINGAVYIVVGVAMSAITMGQQRWLRTLNIEHHQVLPGTDASMAPGFETMDALKRSKQSPDYWASKEKPTASARRTTSAAE